MRIIDDEKLNPRIHVSRDEVIAWLRKIADEAGYADRSASAVQTTINDQNFLDAPELVIMVSNIPNSRQS